jgi:hypothetical protein
MNDWPIFQHKPADDQMRRFVLIEFADLGIAPDAELLDVVVGGNEVSRFVFRQFLGGFA